MANYNSDNSNLYDSKGFIDWLVEARSFELDSAVKYSGRVKTALCFPKNGWAKEIMPDISKVFTYESEDTKMDILRQIEVCQQLKKYIANITELAKQEKAHHNKIDFANWVAPMKSYCEFLELSTFDKIENIVDFDSDFDAWHNQLNDLEWDIRIMLASRNPDRKREILIDNVPLQPFDRFKNGQFCDYCKKPSLYLESEFKEYLEIDANIATSSIPAILTHLNRINIRLFNREYVESPLDSEANHPDNFDEWKIIFKEMESLIGDEIKAVKEVSGISISNLKAEELTRGKSSLNHYRNFMRTRFKRINNN
ncbi:hypothetical protein [Bacteroides acidifaciens]|uniref:hypothetical protein n=1 Tax=Bacteroides acidifaciens TaxID=85831 RepID=UPI00260665FD|nr:hypothetical protein [Bacteroides acidifaciens]